MKRLVRNEPSRRGAGASLLAGARASHPPVSYCRSIGRASQLR